MTCFLAEGLELTYESAICYAGIAADRGAVSFEEVCKTLAWIGDDRGG